jgi:hypothetical protein
LRRSHSASTLVKEPERTAHKSKLRLSGDARAKVPFAHRRVDRRPSSQVEDVLVSRWMF